MTAARRTLLGLTVVGAGAAALAGLSPAAQAAQITPRATVVHSCTTTPAAGSASCFAVRRTDVHSPAADAATADGVRPAAAPAGYGPTDLRNAYTLPSTGGSGATVGIVDAYDDPNAASDLAAYRSTYGLPALHSGQFRKVSQTGSTTALPAANAGWAEEISLDLDMVTATCPSCNIVLVEAKSSTLANLGTAVNQAVSQGAKYVSNSYGGGESSAATSYDSSYFNHPGVAITASTGDSGYGAQYPATSRYVTAVGGTSLRTSSTTRGWTETVWNGAGAGCSAYVAKPAFQSGVTTGCSRRSVADVSAVADPNTGVAVYDTYQDSGWMVFGGTSASSPIVASVYALAGSPGTTPNADPYAHRSSLFDVTSGNDGSCSPAVQCTAGTGYDGPTGLGTPNGTGAFVG